MSDEPALVSEQRPLSEDNKHADDDQRNSQRRRRVEVDRRAVQVREYSGRQNLNIGVPSEQERCRELTQSQEDRGRRGVDERRPDEWQGHAEEHSEFRRSGDLGRLDQVRVDGGETGAHKQVHKGRDLKAGGQDDPRRGVNVDRTRRLVRPPGQIAKHRIGEADPWREQEDPACDARDRRHKDGHDGQCRHPAQPSRKTQRKPGQGSTDDERKDDGSDREHDRGPDRSPDERIREGRRVTVVQRRSVDDEIDRP